MASDNFVLEKPLGNLEHEFPTIREVFNTKKRLNHLIDDDQ